MDSEEDLSIYPTTNGKANGESPSGGNLPHQGNDYGFEIVIDKSQVIDTAVKSIIGGIATGFVLRRGDN